MDHAIKKETAREQYDTFQSTNKITKLGLKQNFHQIIESSPNLPDPISDRQIDREIIDLHLKTGFYPSFDKYEAGTGANEINEIPTNLKNPLITLD